MRNRFFQILLVVLVIAIAYWLFHSPERRFTAAEGPQLHFTGTKADGKTSLWSVSWRGLPKNGFRYRIAEIHYVPFGSSESRKEEFEKKNVSAVGSNNVFEFTPPEAAMCWQIVLDFSQRGSHWKEFWERRNGWQDDEARIYRRVSAVIMNGSVAKNDDCVIPSNDMEHARLRTQTHTQRLSTGDTLINETRFTQGWQDGMYKSSTLSIRWKTTGKTEPISSNSQLLSNMQHFGIETNENHIVVAAGGNVYFRERNGIKGAWNMWKLTSSSEAFTFIKEHLNTHFPTQYESGVFKGGGFLKVKGDFSNNEYPMTIHERGTSGLDLNIYNDLKFPYEVESIDLERAELIAVPRSNNPRLPKLVFQMGAAFGQWMFSAKRSKDL